MPVRAVPAAELSSTAGRVSCRPVQVRTDHMVFLYQPHGFEADCVLVLCLSGRSVVGVDAVVRL